MLVLWINAYCDSYFLCRPPIPTVFLVIFIVIGVMLVTISVDVVGANIIHHIHFMGRQMGKARIVAEKMVHVSFPICFTSESYINYLFVFFLLKVKCVLLLLKYVILFNIFRKHDYKKIYLSGNYWFIWGFNDLNSHFFGKEGWGNFRFSGTITDANLLRVIIP